MSYLDKGNEIRDIDMKSELAQHGASVAKVTAGGAATATTTWMTLSLADLSQYATIASALAVMIYYLVATVLAILKHRQNTKPL